MNPTGKSGPGQAPSSPDGWRPASETETAVASSSAANGPVCTCSATLKQNERMMVSSAHCPTHGVAAFIRSLPDDTDDETDGIEVDDGFEI